MSESNETLPPEEFDVRGCRGAEGIPGNYCVDPVGAPTVTADKVLDMLATASLSLEALRVIESQTSLLRAIVVVNAVYAHMAAYKATAVAGRGYAVQMVAGPMHDAAVLASMFGRHLDDEDVALASAAAALGNVSGA